MNSLDFKNLNSSARIFHSVIKVEVFIFYTYTWSTSYKLIFLIPLLHYYTSGNLPDTDLGTDGISAETYIYSGTLQSVSLLSPYLYHQ